MNMLSNQNTKILLYGLTTAALIAATAVGWWGLAEVRVQPKGQADAGVVAPTAKPETASNTPPLSAFNSAWALRLQRTLYDPAPVVVQVAPPPPPKPPRIQLSGTFVEPGNSRAMIQDPSGATRIYRIGEVIDDAQISVISDDGVTVLHDNASWQLRVGKEPVQQ